MAIYSLILSLAQFILPLPVVHTINCSGYIFIFLVDYFLNGVKINCQQAIGVFLGIVGVLLAGNGRVIMELMDG
jgi:drug/metabolite transporter (DMT)-like permease